MAYKLYWFVNIFLIFQLSLQEKCSEPLGLADKDKIPDESFSASSEKPKEGTRAKYARLNGTKAWVAGKKVSGEYIQVDLGEMFVLTAVATQGRPNQKWPQYISEYYVGYSSDGEIFTELTDENGDIKIFKGHNYADINYLPSTYTRYFRLYAKEFKRQVSTRMELYGCKAQNCSIGNGGCKEICRQVDEAIVKCACNRTGYEPVDGECKDVNECLKSPCEQRCSNTDGSYTCSCKDGYTLNKDGKTCDDVNECGLNHPCEYRCENTVGSYKCHCKKGFKLNRDGKTCDDIDECKEGKPCQQNCNNKLGSYECSCRDGYTLNRYNRRTCDDIDECKQKNICDQHCYNFVGGYNCLCIQGFDLDDDKHHCNDVDECKEDNGGCSNNCTNVMGSFECSCPTGYQLKFDKKTCEDTNECRETNGNCQHFCDNLMGSYKCRCRDGYNLQSNMHSCKDIDECVELTSPCDKSTTNCVNTEPSYRCECKQGFQPMISNSKRCERVKCGAFSTSNKYTVSPPRCLLSDVNVFEDTCNFKCALGYTPADPKKMESTCLANRQWSLYEPACIAAKCPPITSLSNGFVRPPQCTAGVSYPGQCHFFCNNAYDLVGPSAISCQNTGSFNINITTISCKKRVIKLSMSCPSGINAILPPGNKSMSVAGQWKNPYVNVGKITSSHDKNSLFPIGTTKVTFTAKTEDGQTDSCDIRVTISDKEAPTLKSCPTNQYVTIFRGDPVNWPEPKYTDNIGVVSIVSHPYKPGERLRGNTYDVSYTAKDSAGNRNDDCKFKVVVTEKSCRKEDFVIDSKNVGHTCHAFFGNIYCYIQCKDSKQKVLTTKDKQFICYHQNVSWVPELRKDPECVGFSKFTGNCPQGTFKLSDIDRGEICANCRPGTFYNNGVCEKCAVGSYQNEEKQLVCKKCPAGNGTLTTGATKCYNLCSPGSYSTSGFRTDSEVCKVCPVGEYQTNYGSTSCLRCQNGTTTASAGRSSKDDCGSAGKIRIEGELKVTEFNKVELKCYTTAHPRVSVEWKKLFPKPPVDIGRVSEQLLFSEDNKVIGMSYVISRVRYYDDGKYKFQCHTVNEIGEAKQNVTLTVMKNFG